MMKPLSEEDERVVMTIVFGALLGLFGAVFGLAFAETLTLVGLIEPPTPSWWSAAGLFAFAVLGWLLASRIFWLCLRGNRDRELT